MVSRIVFRERLAVMLQLLGGISLVAGVLVWLGVAAALITVGVLLGVGGTLIEWLGDELDEFQGDPDEYQPSDTDSEAP
jgi:phage tail tape-measure protein